MSNPVRCEVLASSFRDPSGFLFRRDGTLYRQVNQVYRHTFERLLSSGLYDELTADGLLIPHESVDAPPASDAAYRVIRPEPIFFTSYPYEWCFSQLQDAARLTVELQRRALARGMTLKDASAYNIQFHRGRPVLIDTLSFDVHREGEPWVAYRQFCQHFLAPLALMSYCDARLSQLLRVHIDGVPLDLASRLLPLRTKLKPRLLAHIHLHAATQRRFADRAVDPKAVAHGRGMNPRAMTGLLNHLAAAVSKLRWEPAGTEWADYYDATNYSEGALAHKERLLEEFIRETGARAIWDLGANTGRMTRVVTRLGLPVVAFDIDPAAVELAYRRCRQAGETHLLPLVLDLTNPSPGLGWAHRERMSLAERGPVDGVLALALIHHLAISNNVPLARLAAYFGGLCRTLIIEFVPKSDSQVRRLLATREDVFPHYHREGFEAAFGREFRIERREAIPGTERTLYLMRRKN